MVPTTQHLISEINIHSAEPDTVATRYGAEAAELISSRRVASLHTPSGQIEWTVVKRNHVAITIPLNIVIPVSRQETRVK